MKSISHQDQQEHRRSEEDLHGLTHEGKMVGEFTVQAQLERLYRGEKKKKKHAWLLVSAVKCLSHTKYALPDTYIVIYVDFSPTCMYLQQAFTWQHLKKKKNVSRGMLSSYHKH